MQLSRPFVQFLSFHSSMADRSAHSSLPHPALGERLCLVSPPTVLEGRAFVRSPCARPSTHASCLLRLTTSTTRCGTTFRLGRFLLKPSTRERGSVPRCASARRAARKELRSVTVTRLQLTKVPPPQRPPPLAARSAACCCTCAGAPGTWATTSSHSQRGSTLAIMSLRGREAVHRCVDLRPAAGQRGVGLLQ